MSGQTGPSPAMSGAAVVSGQAGSDPPAEAARAAEARPPASGEHAAARPARRPAEAVTDMDDAMSGERPGGAQWTLSMVLRWDDCRELAVRVPPEMVYCGKHAGISTSWVSQEFIDDRPVFCAYVDGIVADLQDMTHNCPRA